MKIYQALKLKNLLIGEISELLTKIKDNNSLIKGNKKIYDINELYDTLLERQRKLIDLKTALQVTNGPVYDKIFELSELKSLINYLKEVPADEGRKSALYGREDIMEYECTWNKKQIDEYVNNIQNRISKLQEDLELFNFTVDLKGYVKEK